MNGVENRFLEASDDLDRSVLGGHADERSLILEEKLQDIADALFEDPLLAFVAIKACAERQIREIEVLRSPAARANQSETEPEVSPPAAAYAVGVGPEEFFQRERATFEAIKAGLDGHAGRYVVIKGDEVAGVWRSYEEALDGGYDRFGPVAFFVKQLTNEDPARRSNESSPGTHR